MANPQIEVEIGANIKGLEKELTRAEQNLKRAEAQFREASKAAFGLENSISKLAAQYKSGAISEAQFTKESEKLSTSLQAQRGNIRAIDQEIKRLNGSIQAAKLNSLTNQNNQASKSFTGLTGNIKGSNSVAIEFNRIIQDSPFGLIGIGNNIQQLTQNFANLKNTTGSAGAAIKASLGALISPANLLVLGISAVTAGFTAYQMGAFDGILTTKNLAEQTEKYRESLSFVQKVQLDSLKNADKEIITLNSLRSIIESETTSREQKNKAVERLQKEYPSYFGNLTKEQILAGNLQKTYEALTKTLIARATAEASIQKVVDLQDEERVLLEKTQSVRERISAFEEKAQKNRLAGQQELVTINENQVRFLKQQNPEIARLAEIEDERKRLTESINTNLAQANLLLNDTKEKAEGVGKAFKDIDENILFADLFKGLDKKLENLDLSKSLGLELSSLQGSLKTAEIEKDFISVERIQKRIDQVKGIIENLPKNVNIKSIDIPINFTSEGSTGGKGIIEGLKDQITSIQKLRDVTSDPTRIQLYNNELKLLQENLNAFTSGTDVVKSKVEELSGAFTGLGSLIGKAFNNPQLGTFLGQFASFAAKIIATNFKIASANAITGATSAAVATGPAAPFTLPGFIAASLGLIAGAFAAFGGGGGRSSGASGVGVSGVGSSFTGTGGTGFSAERNINLVGSFRIAGSDLLYVIDQSNQARI
jgi:hypothetical protein